MSVEAEAAAWRREQEVLAQRVVRHDAGLPAFGALPKPEEGRVRLERVGGVDLSYPKDGTGMAVACLVVLSFPGLELEDVFTDCVAIRNAYVAGHLAFREAPPLLALLQRAKAKGRAPQLLFVDGNGILHPRRCCLASHLGVLADVPTIGCAKNLLQIEGLSEEETRERCQRALRGGGDGDGVTWHEEGGQSLELIGGGGELLGAALFGHAKSERPVYVSVGHKVGLASALALTLRCSKHRIVEPIRQADLRSRMHLSRLHLGP